MPWPLSLPRWFVPSPSPRPPDLSDPVGDRLRAAVSENARTKVVCIRTHEARVRSMIDELFLRMEEGHARDDP